MNHAQRGVLATFSVFLLIAAVYFIPWRVRYPEKIVWAPIYRRPISYVRSQDGTASSYRYEDGEVAAGWYVLELLSILTTGGAAYFLTRTNPANEHVADV